MKVELKPPFTKDYKAVYVYTNTEPRRVAVLVSKSNEKTSMSYARYLMSCHLKRFLNKDEHVDHKDEDRLNDVINNLQILTLAENNRKSIIMNGREAKLIKLTCPQCGENFSRSKRNITHKLNNGKTPCCSKSCGGKYSSKNKNSPIKTDVS